MDGTGGRHAKSCPKPKDTIPKEQLALEKAMKHAVEEDFVAELEKARAKKQEQKAEALETYKWERQELKDERDEMLASLKAYKKEQEDVKDQRDEKLAEIEREFEEFEEFVSMKMKEKAEVKEDMFTPGGV